MINSDYLGGFLDKDIQTVMSSGTIWIGKLIKVGTTTFILTVPSSYAYEEPNQAHLSLEHLEGFLEINKSKK